MAIHRKCICTARAMILLLALVLPILAARVGKHNCISSFPELEEELLQRKQNMDSLNEAFFPPNRQLSIVVDVHFYFLPNTSSPSEGSTLENDFTDDQPTLKRLELGHYDYKFRWAASSVVTFIRPDLLEVLSLYTFVDSTKTAKVIIPPICGSQALDTRMISADGHSSQVCSNEAVSQVEKLLNRLTTHLKSYVVNRAVVSEEYRGYSSYYFHHNLSHKHCVIGYARDYKSGRIALTIALVSFIVALSLGTPVAVKSVHISLLKKMESNKEKSKNEPWKSGSNLQYYIWATVIVAVLADVAILLYNAWIIIAVVHAKGLWNALYSLGVGAFFVILGIDMAVCMIYSNSLKAVAEKFPFPFPHCCCSNNEGLRKAGGLLRRAAGILAVVVALQLLSFQGVYMFLGFIASPLTSTTIIIFYYATIFCAVIFVTILLKFFSTIRTPEAEKQPFSERETGKENQKQCTIVKLQSIGYILTGFLMLVFVVSFGVFIFITGMLVIEHNNAGGVVGFVGSLAPSVFLSLVGYCGKKFLDLGSTGDVDSSEEPGQPKPPSQEQSQTVLELNLPSQVQSRTVLELNPSTQVQAQTVLDLNPPSQVQSQTVSELNLPSQVQSQTVLELNPPIQEQSQNVPKLSITREDSQLDLEQGPEHPHTPSSPLLFDQ